MLADKTAGFTAIEVEEAVSGSLVRGEGEMKVSGVSTDSRSLQTGELFVPISGPNFDGHDFIKTAFESGAAGCLAGRGRSREEPEGGFIVEVEDTLGALGDLARYHRGRFELPVVAVTGSNGKTTAKEMIGAILAEGAETLKSEGNLNNFIGLPLQVLGLGPEHERAVFEMGMNRPGEIRRLAEIAAPTVAVITSVAPVHIEGLGSIEAVRDAKGELLEEMGTGGVAVLPGEDTQCAVLADRFRAQGGRVLTFGFEAKNDVCAADVQLSERGEVSFRIRIGGGEEEVRLPVVGRHNALNALAAAAAASELGSPLEEIVRGLEEAAPPAMRLGVEELSGGVFLLNDAYNANPTSVRMAIETVCELKGPGRAFAVLGDMRELGAFEEFAHAEVGRAAAGADLDFLATVGPAMRLAANEAHRAGMAIDRAEVFSSPEEAAAWVAERAMPGDWVLIKGSRSMAMERAVEALRG
jgi:UDP-N-acetylmuramoyl-tripeptide--D-alanyl-D-alanine ligase